MRSEEEIKRVREIAWYSKADLNEDTDEDKITLAAAGPDALFRILDNAVGKDEEDIRKLRDEMEETREFLEDESAASAAGASVYVRALNWVLEEDDDFLEEIGIDDE